MKYQRNYRLSDKTIERLSILSLELGSNDTQIIEDAVRLYLMAHKAKDGEVWNLDDIKFVM